MVTLMDKGSSEQGCSQCGCTSFIIDKEMGETVCSTCGLVADESMLNLGKESSLSDFAEGDKKQRTGAYQRLSMYDRGIATTFQSNTDVYGKRLDLETQFMMRRLKKHDSRTRIEESRMRNLSIAMTELDRMITKLHLPNNVKERAASIYRQALKLNLIKGRSIDAFVTASIYAACRLMKVPRSLKEIASISKQEFSEVSLSYRLIHKEMNLKPPVDDPYKYVPSIASKIAVGRTTEQLAVNILKKGEEKRFLTGKTPRGLAAAALYMACQGTKVKRVQQDIAQAAETTEVTLRKHYRGLKEALNELELSTADLLPDDFIV